VGRSIIRFSRAALDPFLLTRANLGCNGIADTVQRWRTERASCDKSAEFIATHILYQSELIGLYWRKVLTSNHYDTFARI
jgi:hypothetical protein